MASKVLYDVAVVCDATGEVLSVNGRNLTKKLATKLAGMVASDDKVDLARTHVECVPAGSCLVGRVVPDPGAPSPLRIAAFMRVQADILERGLLGGGHIAKVVSALKRHAKMLEKGGIKP